VKGNSKELAVLQALKLADSKGHEEIPLPRLEGEVHALSGVSHLLEYVAAS